MWAFAMILGLATLITNLILKSCMQITNFVLVKIVIDHDGAFEWCWVHFSWLNLTIFKYT